VHDLVVTPAGERLVSGGADGAVRVWDTRGGALHSIGDP
jgi:WD40 repeat protein